MILGGYYYYGDLLVRYVGVKNSTSLFIQLNNEHKFIYTRESHHLKYKQFTIASDDFILKCIKQEIK